MVHRTRCLGRLGDSNGPNNGFVNSDRGRITGDCRFESNFLQISSLATYEDDERFGRLSALHFLRAPRRAWAPVQHLKLGTGVPVSPIANSVPYFGGFPYAI